MKLINLGVKKLFFILSLLLFITCSKDSSQDNSSVYVAPPTNTTNSVTSVTQYTLIVSAGEGGSVSTAGGTYNDGTSISITATPDNGYSFLGWSNGSVESQITINVNSNIEITANFQELPPIYLDDNNKTIVATYNSVPGNFYELNNLQY